MNKVSFNSNGQYFFSQLLWLGILLGISMAILMLLPFPLSLGIVIVVIILLNFYMGRRMIRRMGIEMKGAGIFNSPSMSENTLVRYYCMSCGLQHRQAACPKCGSKMKRVGASWKTFLGTESQKAGCTAYGAPSETPFLAASILNTDLWKRYLNDDFFLNLSGH